jgi:hypothetical protein
MPLDPEMGAAPDGAMLSGDPADKGKIAVVYNRGESPPEITIHDAGGPVQTVMANGVAVAIVARADGPPLTGSDVLLVERFGAPAS